MKSPRPLSRHAPPRALRAILGGFDPVKGERFAPADQPEGASSPWLRSRSGPILLTKYERRWLRQMIQGIAALFVLGPTLDARYQDVVVMRSPRLSLSDRSLRAEEVRANPHSLTLFAPSGQLPGLNVR